VREDKRLLWGLKRGDEDALRQIYMKYKDKLLTVAVYLLNDICAAEDVLHDVFVSVAKNAGDIQLRGSLQNYLIACILNGVRDQFRKDKHRKKGLEATAGVGSESDNPQQSAIFSEESRLLADALILLPLEQRETVLLHLAGGFKFKEIAQMQDLPISTVQARYKYGLDKLRALLYGELGR
jgi:RNA polymerase sigma-70 factor (ECF subfamily)